MKIHRHSSIGLALFMFLGPLALAQKTTLVSSDGINPLGFSTRSDVSDDGRFVAFQKKPGLVGDAQIYVRDRQLNAAEIVSLDPGGNPANGFCDTPRLSADGRFLVFTTAATNLIPDANGAFTDVLVLDRQTGSLAIANSDQNGAQGLTPAFSPDISGDGRWIAFVTSASLVSDDTNSALDVYVYDRVTTSQLRVSIPDGPIGAGQSNASSFEPSLSFDGLRVAFCSAATNLIANDTNARNDIFLRDRSSQQTFRIFGNGFVQPNHESNSPSLSHDGTRVAYVSLASNLVQGDTNSDRDIFVFDGQLAGNTRASVKSDGTQAVQASSMPALSGDGQSVAFECQDNLIGPSSGLAISRIYAHETSDGETTQVSQFTVQTATLFISGWPSISESGRYVSFETVFSDGIDANGFDDIYVRDRSSEAVTFCETKINSLGCVPAIGATGSASMTSAQPFDVVATQVLNNKNGLFFYSSVGLTSLPFLGGTLCGVPPLRRTSITNSLGNPPPSDCSGTMLFEFNAWVQSGADPFLNAGSEITGQFWSRDPQSSNGVGLTNAVYFVICP